MDNILFLPIQKQPKRPDITEQIFKMKELLSQAAEIAKQKEDDVIRIHAIFMMVTLLDREFKEIMSSYCR